MKTIKFRAAAALAAAGALLLTACGGGGGASTEGGESITLESVTMVQPGVPAAPVENWIYDELESRSDGRIKVNRSEPESICKAAEIAECIRDGRADIGVSIADYTPQLFPTLTVVTIPFMVNNSQALMQSLHQVNQENADAQAKWDSIGLKMMGAWGPGKLILGSKEPMLSVNDINGVRYRVTGGFLQRAFEGAGANVVALTAGETYDGIRNGTADAVAWTMDGVVDYKMMEQLGVWTDPGVGHYTTFSAWLNTDVYEGMPADLQKIVDEVITDLNAGAGMEQFNEPTDAQCDAMLDFQGIESFTAWEEAQTNEWKDKVQQELIDSWAAEAEKNGLNNAQAYFDEYRKLLEEAAASPDIVEDPVEACVTRFAEER